MSTTGETGQDIQLHSDMRQRATEHWLWLREHVPSGNKEAQSAVESMLMALQQELCSTDAVNKEWAVRGLLGPAWQALCSEDGMNIVGEAADDSLQSLSPRRTFVPTVPLQITDFYGFTVSMPTMQKVADQLRVLEGRRKDWEKFLSDHGSGHYDVEEGGCMPSRAVHPLPERSVAFRSLIRQGIPVDLRGCMWFHLSGAQQKMQDAGGSAYFSRMRAKLLRSEGALPSDGDIDKDLGRTWTGNRFMDESMQQKLRTVLRAYSVRNPSVGYCQGMNFLASLLLLFMSEEHAFWVLSAIVEDVLPGYFHSALVGALTDQAVFRELALRRCSKSMKVFAMADASALSMVTTEWFMCLFSKNMPSETTFRIWDSVFYEGSKTLFRVGLAVLRMCESALQETTNVMQAFATLNEACSGMHNADALLNIAFVDFKSLQRRTIKNLRQSFSENVRKDFNERQVMSMKAAIAEEGYLTSANVDGLLHDLSEVHHLADLSDPVISFEAFSGLFVHAVPWLQDENAYLQRLFVAFHGLHDRQRQMKPPVPQPHPRNSRMTVSSVIAEAGEASSPCPNPNPGIEDEQGLAQHDSPLEPKRKKNGLTVEEFIHGLLVFSIGSDSNKCDLVAAMFDVEETGFVSRSDFNAVMPLFLKATSPTVAANPSEFRTTIACFEHFVFVCDEDAASNTRVTLASPRPVSIHAFSSICRNLQPIRTALRLGAGDKMLIEARQHLHQQGSSLAVHSFAPGNALPEGSC